VFSLRSPLAVHRTTIEIDEELPARARAALGLDTTRATVEEALRRSAAQAVDPDNSRRVQSGRSYPLPVGSWTTETKKWSICLIASMNPSKSTGLVT